MEGSTWPIEHYAVPTSVRGAWNPTRTSYRVSASSPSYVCPEGHRTELPFSIEADVPPTWECRCGLDAKLQGGGPEPEAKPVKHQRTHWDMLLERRSIPELEELLEERLTLLRESRGREAASAQDRLTLPQQHPCREPAPFVEAGSLPCPELAPISVCRPRRAAQRCPITSSPAVRWRAAQSSSMISPSTTSSLDVERCGPSGASRCSHSGVASGHREVRVGSGLGDEAAGDDRREQVARHRPHEGQHEDEADDVRRRSRARAAGLPRRARRRRRRSRGPASGRCAPPGRGRARPRPPSRRISHAPSSEVATSSRKVGQPPMAWPTATMTTISMIGRSSSATTASRVRRSPSTAAPGRCVTAGPRPARAHAPGRRPRAAGPRGARCPTS